MAFHAVFDPKNPKAVWETRPLTPEERDRLDIDDPFGEVEQNIGKKRNNHRLAWQYLNDDERAVSIIDDMLSGCLDDVIAANLAVRESVIADFKRQHGLSEEAIKPVLPSAKSSAKNIKENFTSDILANEIWKLLKDNKKEDSSIGTDQI